MITFEFSSEKQRGDYVSKPLFQLCSFLIRTLPSGLKGPFSENAPNPREEQPGPTKYRYGTSIYNSHFQIKECNSIFFLNIAH